MRTAPGQACYRLRKSTVEPVIGIVKEVQRYRQCSLRGGAAASSCMARTRKVAVLVTWGSGGAG
ncbi:MAG: hypothetical protein FJX77_07735 [Armatimonadetes bacterium]|nr:hypothetical protein [Armatimonadota bacterium]